MFDAVALVGAEVTTAVACCLGGAGLAFCCLEGSLGPSLTSIAIVLSRSPPCRLSMSMFLSLSGKPISRNCASFSCKSLSGNSLTEPEVGLYSTGVTLNASCTPALSFFEDVLKLNPKNLCFLAVGGSSGVGGGWNDCVKLGDTSAREGGSGLPSTRLFSWYFFRMNLSMAESTSSASSGISGFLFFGLKCLFDAVLPFCFILWWLSALTSSSHGRSVTCLDLICCPLIHTK